MLEDYLLKRRAHFELQNVTVTSNRSWSKPVQIIDEASDLELQYRDHLEALVSVCRGAGDELSVLKIADLLQEQLQSVNEFDEIQKKAKMYSALEGLYYHLDKELGKK